MRKAHKSKAEKCAFTVSKCDFAVFFFDKNNQNRLSVWAVALLSGVGAFCKTPAVCAAWLN